MNDQRRGITDGMRLLAQLRNEGVSDVLAQGRFDSRTLAIMLRYFLKQGIMPRSSAELIKLGIESFRKYLVDNGIEEEVYSVSDAVQMMAECGIKNLNPSGRGKQARIKQLQKESLILDGDGEVGERLQYMSKKVKPKSPNEWKKAAMEAIKNLSFEGRGYDLEEVKSRMPEGLVEIKSLDESDDTGIAIKIEEKGE